MLRLGHADGHAVAFAPCSGVHGAFHESRHRKDQSAQGVVLQKQNAGGGFFLGTNQSGSVYFGLPEAFSLFAR